MNHRCFDHQHDDPTTPCSKCFPELAAQAKPASALAVQVGGGHYKAHGIQPIEYIHANNIPFAEGCVIKYVSRWRDKGGLQDLQKAKHFIELLMELETRKGTR